MAQPPHINDEVFVSCSGIVALDEQQTALYRTRVVDETDAKIKVSLPNAEISNWIQKRRAHSSVGMVIVAIGDFVSEAATLDPLAKSVTQFCRLIVPDDYIRFLKVRSMAEIKVWWEINHDAYQYVIIIGHGDDGALCTAIDGCRPVRDWLPLFEGAAVMPKNFLISACKAGAATFAREFSSSPSCNYLIAPYQSVNSAISSQFIQSFFSFRFIDGQTEKTAFRNGRNATAGGTSFRLWRRGRLDMA